MRVVFALACLVAVAAAAASLEAVDSLTSGNGQALNAANAAVGSSATGSVLKIVTAVAKAAQGTQQVWWRASTATDCNTITDPEKAQTVGWSDDGTNIVVYLDISTAPTTGNIICVANDISNNNGVKATFGGTPTDVSFDASATAAPAATASLAASPGNGFYYGQSMTLTGAAAFAGADAFAVGTDFAVAKTNGIVWTAAGATATVKATGVASATYKVYGILAAEFVAASNTMAAQQTGGADIAVEYIHATLNSTLTDVKVNGGAAESKAAANYTKGSNFTFKLTNTDQGNDYMVVAVPTGKTCAEMITAGMFVNATQGATYSQNWWAKTVGVYEIYAKTYGIDAAGKLTVACTKQMFGTVNIVEPPMPPPTPAPAPAPAPVAPAPAAAASTTGTSSASAIRGGLLAAFACVLAGLGVSAAF